MVSGGFLTWAAPLARDLGIDYAIANQFGVDKQGKMSGKLMKGSIVIDDEQKARILAHLTKKPSISDLPAYALAVGDGGNDKKMIIKANPFGDNKLLLTTFTSGVAFNGKEVLREVTNFQINEVGFS